MRTNRIPSLTITLLLVALPARAGTLTGRVLGDGSPVAGAVVSALPYETPLEAARSAARRLERKPIASATTRADGTFELSVPAGTPERWFDVRLEAKGWVAADQPGSWGTGETESLGDLSLTTRSGPLAGRVAGRDGKPVAGARVTLTPRRARGEASDLDPVAQTATSGADGTFRLEAAGTGANRIVVEAKGFATARVEAPSGGALRAPVVLQTAASLTGNVKRRDGRPAPGALVRWEDGGLATRWVEADASGAFRLGDLPSRRGRVVVDAGEDGWAEAPGVVPDDAAKPLALVLAPPAVLGGRTVDAATLRPVPRVKLTVKGAAGSRVERSGPDGKYAFRGLRPEDVDVKADEARYVPWERGGVKLVRGETKTLDVPLTPGAALSGRVVDEDGRPVADAKGAVGRNIGGVPAFFAALRGEKPAFRTRSDGTFVASRLAPGENQNLTVTHPEHERGVLGGIALTPGGTKAGLLVTLRRGLVLAGRVHDADGKPIAGAEVTLAQSFTVRPSRGGARAVMNLSGRAGDLPGGTSGPDGRFELRGVASGDYTVRVKASGWATETIDPVKVAREAPAAPLDVLLVPGATISGTVRRRTGNPAEGFLVIPRAQGASSPGMGGPDTMPTGPDGAFLLEGLRAGAVYDLQVMGGGTGLGPTQKGVTAPADGVEVVVSGTGRIEGNAVDAKSGRPLTSFDVSYEPDRGGPGRMVFRIGRSGGGRGFGSGEKLHVEAEDGRFALEEVPAGKWSVVVEARGYQAARAGSVVVEEATTTDGVEVRVPPGSVLKGRVTDAKSGRPVVEASVSASVEGGSAMPFPPGLFSGGGDGLLTDADGRYEVEGLAPGKVTLRVDHSDYEEQTVSVDLKEGGTTADVALSAGGTLGGTVLSPTRQPVAGADVTVTPSGEGGFGRGPFGGGMQSAVSDASGRFRIEHLAAGRYSASASISGQSSDPQAAVLTAGEAKEDLVLLLAGGATLRGLVSGLPAGQAGGVSVFANGPQQYTATTRTGADGRFELTGLPVGTTNLGASAGDMLAGASRTATAHVTIAEGQTEAEAEIVFEGTATLSGSVKRGSQPVPGAMVFAGGRQGGGNASTRTDDSGAFRMEGLQDGTYNVSAQPMTGAGGRGVSKTVQVSGDTTVDLEVPTASLSGVVVAAATKQPLEGVQVTATIQGGATTDAGRRFGGATTDTNGRWFLDDVEPGTWDVVFRRAGYLEETRSAAAVEGGGDGGTVEMTRGEGLELQVTDGIYGIPLRGASVRVKDAAGADAATTFVTLDVNGRGEVPSVKPGTYSILVESSGYATRRYDGVVVPASPLPVALTPGGSVEVRAGEASRAKGSATLLDALGRPCAFRAFGGEGKLFLPASGVATIPNLVPGSYTLAVDGIASKGFAVTEGGRSVVDLP